MSTTTEVDRRNTSAFPVDKFSLISEYGSTGDPATKTAFPESMAISPLPISE